MRPKVLGSIKRVNKVKRFTTKQSKALTKPMFNPERGDYDALDASRSVLSGSAKPMVNPERGDYDALDASRSVLSGSAKPMVNG